MKCPNCNAELRKDANFCGSCRFDLSESNVQRASSTDLIRANKVPIAIVCAGLLVAAAILLAAVLIPKQAGATVYDVKIRIEAPEYTESDSPIPIRVTGSDKRGEPVDSVAYVDSSGDGLRLPPGTYELSLEASPLCKSGIVYAEASSSIKITVDDRGNEDYADGSDSLELMPCSPDSITEEQIKAACNAARDAGFDSGRVEEYETATYKRASIDPDQTKVYAAFYDKLREIVDEYGLPKVVSAGQAQYISGLAFARLVDFGGEHAHLLVSYYDPSLDEDPSQPGSRQACYPVEVWEYGNGELSKVYQGQAQLEGQNVYCSSVFLREREGQHYLVELDNLSAPNGYSGRKIYGVDVDGKFGQLISLRQEWKAGGPDAQARFLVDGQEVSEEEYDSADKKWDLGQASIKLSGGFSNRDVEPACKEAMDLYTQLPIDAGLEQGQTDSNDSASESSETLDADIETDEFVFTLPEYWQGKVDWTVGVNRYGYNQISIFPIGGNPEHGTLLKIGQYPPDITRNRGDVGAQSRYVEGNGRVYCLSTPNWPYRAWWEQRNKDDHTLDGIDDVTISKLVDLSAEGTIDLAGARGLESESDVAMFGISFSETFPDRLRIK